MHFFLTANLQRDSEVITDPSFSFTVSPPVRWTYFPPITVTGSVQVANYFPGQSTTSGEALLAAQNEVLAAFLEALNQIPYPIVGASTTVNYSPDQISNCYIGQPIPAGTKIGYLAAGAITQIAIVSGQSATATSCPLPTTMQQTNIGPYEEYTKMVTVSTKGGITLPRYDWNLVLSQFQSILNFKYMALLRSPITINSNN
ncbi:unnamed protein product [Nippostrongylus brasiliensis]|uniref:SLBB domain-containing protein n=1 Tax=Nippostrongylus brasiliensis TaxID=27835 RepID=A0A0N4XQ49_NIPBR|nr:unnamed protein product [Nippostrongylus brasiliensis]